MIESSSNYEHEHHDIKTPTLHLQTNKPQTILAGRCPCNKKKCPTNYQQSRSIAPDLKPISNY